MKRVTKIMKVESVDVVVDPATTSSLRESKDQDKKETAMNLEELKAKHPELYAQVIKEGRDAGLAEAKGDEKTKQLEADLAEAKAKVAGFEAATKDAERKTEVAKLLKDSKIPEAARTTELTEAVENAKTVDEAKAVLAVAEAQYLKAAGKPRSDERTGGGDEKKAITVEETVKVVKG